MDDNNSSVITRNVVTLGYDINKSYDSTNEALKTVSLGTTSSYSGSLNNVISAATLGTSSAFDCAGFGTTSFLSYNDAAPTSSSRIYIYASNQVSAGFGSCFIIGVLDPILDATGTRRIAYTNINLGPFKTLYLYNPLGGGGSISNAYCTIVD
jgi:hypothetical protein